MKKYLILITLMAFCLGLEVKAQSRSTTDMTRVADTKEDATGRVVKKDPAPAPRTTVDLTRVAPSRSDKPAVKGSGSGVERQSVDMTRVQGTAIRKEDGPERDDH